MSYISELIPLIETVRNPHAGTEVSRPSMAIPPEAEAKWDAILEAYKDDSQMLLLRLADGFQDVQDLPWAVIAFPEEYRLAGHLVSIRKDRRDFVFSAYSVNGGYSIPVSGPPPLSIVLVFNKAAFGAAARESPLLSPSWQALGELSEDLKWFCLSDPPPAEWLARAELDDDALFMKTMRF